MIFAGKDLDMTAVPPARISHPETGEHADPRVEALVNDVIGRVADKWTMLILEVLAEHGEQRFTRVGDLVGGISQKMLTQTLRQMERDGLVVRTVHPVNPAQGRIPPDRPGRHPGRGLLRRLDLGRKEHRPHRDGAG